MDSALEPTASKPKTHVMPSKTPHDMAIFICSSVGFISFFVELSGGLRFRLTIIAIRMEVFMRMIDATGRRTPK